jgi:uncharacterized membrane protein YdjX (TVP38/TMEM64 family)
MPALGGFVLLYYIRPVSEWLVSLGNGGVALYAGVFIVTAGLGLLPTYAQAFLGGWAFGPVVGTIAALLGFVGASCVGRPIATRIGRTAWTRSWRATRGRGPSATRWWARARSRRWGS